MDERRDVRDGAGPEADFEAALSDLPESIAARRGAPAAPSPPTANPFAPRRREAVRRAAPAAAALVLLALALVLRDRLPWSAAAPGGAPLTPPQATLAALGRDPLACLAGAAWSPDGSRVALLGNRHDCPETYGAYLPGVLEVFDVATQRPIGELMPDDPIVRALGATTGAASDPAALPVIRYDSVSWSPDGSSMALTFLATTRASGRFDGVLTLDGRGGHPRVGLLGDDRSQQGTPYVEWDLRRSPPAAVASAAGRGTVPGSNVDPALAYAWQADGTLLPVTPLGASAPPAPPLVPVGDPDGAAAFSVWQSGQAWVGGAWGIGVSAWSPDGRFLVGTVDVLAQFAPAATPIILGHPAVLPVRDAGLGQVLRRVARLSSTDQIDSFAEVAWRPDGREVAARVGGTSVEIYDCASGRLLATLDYATRRQAFLPAGQPLAAGPALSWSPDGTHLLLINSGVDMGPDVLLWGPGELPG